VDGVERQVPALAQPAVSPAGVVRQRNLRLPVQPSLGQLDRVPEGGSAVAVGLGRVDQVDPLTRVTELDAVERLGPALVRGGLRRGGSGVVGGAAEHVGGGDDGRRQEGDDRDHGDQRKKPGPLDAPAERAAVVDVATMDRPHPHFPSRSALRPPPSAVRPPAPSHPEPPEPFGRHGNP